MKKEQKTMLANLEIYDNGGETADRYTVVFMDQITHRFPGAPVRYTSLGMSDEPFDPQGFCQHSDAIAGPHLGKRIEFHQLPEPCRKAVGQEINGPLPKKTILVALKSGVIYQFENLPPGYTVLVRDFDASGADPDKITLAPNGDECIESSWGTIR